MRLAVLRVLQGGAEYAKCYFEAVVCLRRRRRMFHAPKVTIRPNDSSVEVSGVAVKMLGLVEVMTNCARAEDCQHR